jgi:hypothetical protein
VHFSLIVERVSFSVSDITIHFLCIHIQLVDVYSEASSCPLSTSNALGFLLKTNKHLLLQAKKWMDDTTFMALSAASS